MEDSASKCHEPLNQQRFMEIIEERRQMKTTARKKRWSKQGSASSQMSTEAATPCFSDKGSGVSTPVTTRADTFQAVQQQPCTPAAMPIMGFMVCAMPAVMPPWPLPQVQPHLQQVAEQYQQPSLSHADPIEQVPKSRSFGSDLACQLVGQTAARTGQARKQSWADLLEEEEAPVKIAIADSLFLDNKEEADIKYQRFTSSPLPEEVSTEPMPDIPESPGALDVTVSEVDKKVSKEEATTSAKPSDAVSSLIAGLRQASLLQDGKADFSIDRSRFSQ